MRLSNFFSRTQRLTKKVLRVCLQCFLACKRKALSFCFRSFTVRLDCKIAMDLRAGVDFTSSRSEPERGEYFNFTMCSLLFRKIS